MSNLSISKEKIDQAKEWLRCKKDPLYFIDNYIKIPTPGNSNKLKLYEPQKRVVRDFYDKNHLIFLKSRQIGISTVTQSMICHMVTFYHNCVIGIISKDGDESTDFARKVKVMIEELPDWMRVKYINNQIQYFVLENGSSLYARVVNKSNPAAVFRGKSLVLLVMDEAAFIEGIDKAWTGIAPSLSLAHKQAKANNIPFGTILISTPNGTQGKGAWYFNQWQLAVSKESKFIPHQIHWSEIPTLRDDPNWYNQQCQTFNYDKKKIAQELELKFVSSDDSLFSEETQERLQQITEKPKSIHKFPYGGEAWIFEEKLDIGKFYLIGVDTASSAGEDFSTVQVMDYETMNQVLEYKGKLEPKMFANVVKKIAKLLPNNIIIVENTGGFGLTIINELQFDEEVEYNIYGEMKETGKKEFRFGLSTTSRSRPLILDSLFDYINDNTSIIKSERLSMELLALTTKGDKVQAENGFHDDLAMAWGFCCYVRKYKSNLLGDTSRKENSEEYTTKLNGSNILSDFIKLNSDTPLYADYVGSENFKDFKNSLNRFLNEEMGKTIVGEINTIKLFRQ